MLNSTYTNLIHPTEEIIIDDNKVLIVDIPLSNIHGKQNLIDDILKKYGVNKNEMMGDGSSYRWGEYFNDVLLVQQSLRIPETVKFDKGTVDYGKPYYTSLEDYENKVGSRHTAYLKKVLDFRSSCIPDYSDISINEMTELLDGILSSDTVKKKHSEDIVNGFGMFTLTRFLIFTVEELMKCRKENLRFTTLLKRQNTSGENTKSES